ncbi:pyridine nucleotide-disulfide oxidoreductase-like protein [Lasiosphaeria hispida]|uniref:Pyridine nucleotide-disulfide oxidoreductase-like protein n=1 Tax=Lasiosphaeria hispida TaxID=260671 RepID=A0AAJ0HAX1_9PEZI|nr:pyridine nucleotide-disulfide oxidoreductase-like protein [Lasiosphaeria hispida]
MGSMFDSSPQAPFKVLVIGGSYGGLSAALNLRDLCSGRAPRCGEPAAEGEPPVAPMQVTVEITIIDERDGFYHLIGSPLALASESFAEKAWIKFDEMPALRAPHNKDVIRVRQGSVQAVDPARKVATFVARGAGLQTEEVRYDYLVVAAGLRRVWPVVPQSLRRKQYLFEAAEHIRAVTGGRNGVVVVGGGAVGVEMASELKLVHPHLKVTLVHSRDKLLSAEPLPDNVGERALELLREGGVDVLLPHRLDRAEEIKDESGNVGVRVHFANGDSMLADQVIMAVSKSVPTTTFLPKDVLDEQGYVRIQPSLNFPSETPNAADHFAAGDLVRWSGIKRCGGAMHMGHFAAVNVHQRMQQKLSGAEPKLSELSEVPPMMGLAVGKKAVAYWPEAGMTSGEDVLKAFFGDDLGFTICYNYLQLGGDKAT